MTAASRIGSVNGFTEDVGGPRALPGLDAGSVGAKIALLGAGSLIAWGCAVVEDSTDPLGALELSVVPAAATAAPFAPAVSGDELPLTRVVPDEESLPALATVRAESVGLETTESESVTEWSMTLVILTPVTVDGVATVIEVRPGVSMTLDVRSRVPGMPGLETDGAVTRSAAGADEIVPAPPGKVSDEVSGLSIVVEPAAGAVGEVTWMEELESGAGVEETAGVESAPELGVVDAVLEALLPVVGVVWSVAGAVAAASLLDVDVSAGALVESVDWLASVDCVVSVDWTASEAGLASLDGLASVDGALVVSVELGADV